MNQLKDKLIAAAQRLQQASREIQSIPGMQAQAETMLERAERLQANRFTVALFGAFSAGKSSFANALMGELVLPVSPNPTTAAINKIMPPTETHPHGTVRVVLKSREAVEQDVIRSLAIFGLAASDLEEALAELNKIDVSSIPPTAKPHYTFLKAVTKGLGVMSAHLGGELLVDMKAFKGFVAKEEKACFAEYIELFYSCPLTDQGIVLVDTPGADSINARHTGVAFEYMKNADAVLFVTYYNHAFSQADREFLLQMGRVKDTFDMDKMFFLVNAADLAASEEELAGVVAHVEKNLLSCGIRHPRIYPVSSQTALLARMHEAGKLAGSAEKVYRQRTGTPEEEPLAPAEEALRLSGMAVFEQDFLRFTLEELTQIAVNAAMGEIRRAHTTLEEFIRMAEADESERDARRQAATKAREAALAAVEGLSIASAERDLLKEREELVYYVKQRLFFRFNELFNTAFNPAVLKEDGRNMKQALQGCLGDLLRSISYDLAQELRATTLRLEKFLGKQGAALVQQWQRDVQQYASGLTLAPYQPRKVETLSFADELPVSLASLQPSLSLFRSAKDFFEQDGKAKLREDLEKRLQEPVSAYLNTGSAQVGEQFASLLTQMVAEERSRVAEQVEAYFTGIFAALDMNLDIDELKAKLERVASLITEA
ncbi:dynamin family protein [Brevibacillus borstelensis]|jgi:predicted GTPase|uniref:dynamin family protein n=1 Tax=Brevibacillus borstelensis TaxID=45462 RepID=UPI001561B9C2|nr:dynamin family protein [Brevibacillus borstelensis]MBE5394176.1 dynamin family protein [Brevibacillus borstelensis]MCM3621546.1 dynamin family protein [Brevibacillus borstelensis]MED2009590.1 dynamin family protein [Brevibacillus borstelensis]